MSVSRPWAEKYADDPVTQELLSRGVNIPYHEDLHKAANGFLDPPFKGVLGPINTEALGMYHYTVHIKLGIAREYLDELKGKLNANAFRLVIDPSFTFQKLLSGFFANLLACYDNLSQEIRLLFSVAGDEKTNIWDILQTVRLANDNVQLGKASPQEHSMIGLWSIFRNVQADIDLMARYRNYLTHRKLVSSMAAVSASAPGMPLKWYEMKGVIPSGTAPFPLASGAFTSFMGSGIANTSSEQIMVHILRSTKIHPAKFYLPKPGKLDLLPTQLNLPADLDDREITEVCEGFYSWTVDFLGKTYEALTTHFCTLT